MSIDVLLASIAALGLPGAPLPSVTEPLPQREWEALVAVIRFERLHGLLAAATASGALPATDDQRSMAESAHIATMTRAVELEQAAVRAITALASGGVETRVLKGLAVAHLDEADPSLRSFADVDLLIRSEQFERAVEVIQDVGYERDLPERRPGFDRRFGKEVSLRSGSMEIDLHRLLVLGAFGLRSDPMWLWDRSTALWLGDLEARALDGERRALHAATALLLSDPVPRRVLARDLALLLTNGNADPIAARELAETAGLDAVLAAAVRHVTRTLRITGLPLADWAGSYRTGWRTRAALATYESQGGSNTLTLLGGVLGLASTGERLAYLRALVAPSPKYRAARRSTSRPNEFRRGLRELLRGPRRTRASA